MAKRRIKNDFMPQSVPPSDTQMEYAQALEHYLLEIQNALNEGRIGDANATIDAMLRMLSRVTKRGC